MWLVIKRRSSLQIPINTSNTNEMPDVSMKLNSYQPTMISVRTKFKWNAQKLLIPSQFILVLPFYNTASFYFWGNLDFTYFKLNPFVDLWTLYIPISNRVQLFHFTATPTQYFLVLQNVNRDLNQWHLKKNYVPFLTRLFVPIWGNPGRQTGSRGSSQPMKLKTSGSRENSKVLDVSILK